MKLLGKDQKKLFAKLTLAATKTLAPTSRLTALSHIAGPINACRYLWLELSESYLSA